MTWLDWLAVLVFSGAVLMVLDAVLALLLGVGLFDDPGEDE